MQPFGPQGKEDQEYAIFLGARAGGTKLCSLLRARGREAIKIMQNCSKFCMDDADSPILFTYYTKVALK